MGTREAISAYVTGSPLPEDPHLSVENQVLFVDGWWVASLWVGRSVVLVRTDGDGPLADVAPGLGQALQAAGYRILEIDSPLIDGITLQRLSLVGADWQVWGTSEEEAAEAILGGVVGEGAPEALRDAGEALESLSALERGAEHREDL